MAKDGTNGKRNGKAIKRKAKKVVEPQRGDHGHFLPGHAPPSPGRPPSRKVTAALLRLGDEMVTVVDASGKAVQMERNEALARGLWSDALAAKSAPVKIHAREYLGKRIDPAPEETERSLMPANQEIHSELTINILQALADRTGGAPTTRDVLEELAKTPVVWHMNGEAEREKP